MIIFVRHGKTEFNTVGGEKLRGWLPVPLTLEGMKEAEEAAQALENIDGITSVYCATLVRVVQSAHEIGEVLSLPLEPMEELNDWNTGDFAGDGVKQTLEKLHDHIQHPLKSVPGGETFQFFLDRIIPVLKDFVESDDRCVVCSSGRISTLLKALSANKGEHPSTTVLLGKPPIDPSGIMIVDKDWSVIYQTEKDDESKGMS